MSLLDKPLTKREHAAAVAMKKVEREMIVARYAAPRQTRERFEEFRNKTFAAMARAAFQSARKCT